MSDKILIFGHKNPDTDSICSAIACADLQRQLGKDVEAVRLGEINTETRFALEYFGWEMPRYLSTATGKEVILVDHNERQQSVADIEQAHILAVIDHHRIANFSTKLPLYYRAEPVGCTATILQKMYKEYGKTIPGPIAGLMLSAIISDSLLFNSPTCTAEDHETALELAQMVGVDLESYGLKLLKAGADLRDKTIAQLIRLDAKEFSLGDVKIEIAQINTVDVEEILAKQGEIEAEMAAVVQEKALDLFLFVITDILLHNSVGLVIGKKADAVERAYNIKLENNRAFMKGIVSRKAQIVPILTEILTKN